MFHLAPEPVHEDQAGLSGRGGGLSHTPGNSLFPGVLFYLPSLDCFL